MRCIVCDSESSWENVDQYRLKKRGMHICNNCGFVSYPNLYKSEEEIKNHYDKDEYRSCPQWGNQVTGLKKLHIHAHFLKDVFEDWKKRDLKNPVVCDIGAAQGMLLNWIRSVCPDAELNGTEYTESYRLNAWHEYKIKLGKDFDKTKKYDLITSFKVAEHQLDIDKRLIEYKECLTENGLLYISVPTWFSAMTNFGKDGFDIEYYYDPNHINVWTKKLFEQVLKKAGLEVIKHDGYMYDDTYLCRRNDSLMSDKLEFENPVEIKKIMSNIKDASLLYEQGLFAEAIAMFKKYPLAYKALYESTRANAHKQNDKPAFEYVWENIVDPCLKAMGEDLLSLQFALEICMRYEKYEQGLELANKGLGKRPNHAGFLYSLGICLYELALRQGEEKDKLKLLKESRDCFRYLSNVDLQVKQDALNYVYRLNSLIPISDN